MSISTSANNNRPSVNNVETLVQSGKAVEQVIIRDQEYPDLLTLLTGPTSDMYIKSLLTATDDLLQTNCVPIPALLREKINSKGLESRCFWGVFPEINRAWLTIDHELYIWNYSYPSEIYEYHDQDQIIVTVGLVKPKAGVFEDHINHVLVISTALQVILIALSVTSTEFKVYATDFAVPADDIQMKIIKGTEDGRIFMIGGGKPYEFKYRHPSAWTLVKYPRIECKVTPKYKSLLPTWKRKIEEISFIRSVAVDDERKLLYLLTDDSIEVVDIGHPNDDYKTIFKHSTIIETAVQMCRQNSRNYSNDAFTLVSAHVISKAESKKVHLMAMTAAGFRLYFSTYKDAFRQNMVYGGDNTSMVSTTLEMGHVRLPPADAHQSIPGQPNAAFRHTYYDCGVCLSVKAFNEDVDSIYCSAPATNTIPPPTQPAYSGIVTFNQPRSTYIETMSTIKTTAKAWLITESRPEMKGKRHIKEISEQISDVPRQFMALTSTSLVFYNKLRPVDILLRIVQDQGKTPQEEQKDYEAFFGRYGKTESCAMCLSIICNIDNQDIVKKATQLFFELGGSPTSATTSQTIGNHLGQVIGQTGITYSGKHDGFVLYLARLLMPVWKLKIFEKCHPANPNASVLRTKIQSQLYEVRGNLEKLREFMNINPQFHDSANISDPRFQAADRSKLELDLAEQKSVHDMFLLLAQAIDAVHFFDFLLDSSINAIFLLGRCSMDQLRKMFELDLSSMIITNEGRELAIELVIITIGEYGSTVTHAPFDVVSHELEIKCNNFFGVKDTLFFKGIEHVKLALKTETEFDRVTNIRRSLDYFKEAADHISTPRLKSICEIYVKFSFHVGIIELSIARASKLDPLNLSEAAFENTQGNDDAKAAILRARMESYNFALDALSDVQLLKSNPLPPHRTPIQDVAVYIRNVFDTAIRSTDPLFHYRLYGWFMKNGLQEELLSFETPYLVPYFKKNLVSEESSLEFLWRYYRNKEHYMEAAASLVKLVKLNSPSLNLKTRTQYLSFAYVNAQSESDPQGIEIEFSNRIKQMLDDSQLQLRVQEILRSSEGIEAQLAADRLDKELLDREGLLLQYGSKFHFLEPVFTESI